MKAHNTSIAELEPGDFLTSGDYEIFKGILASQQVLDLQYLSRVMQKDLRYLSEILRKMKLSSFNIKKQVQKGSQKHQYHLIWQILAIASIFFGIGLYIESIFLFVTSIPSQGYYTFIAAFGLVLIPYFLYYRRGLQWVLPPKPVVQYVTAFKSSQEIDAFLQKIQELESKKKIVLEQQGPKQKRYYLSFQVAALIGLVDGIIFIAFGIWFGYRQIITSFQPFAFALFVPGVILIIIPCYYYSYFRGDSLIQAVYELEKHFQESLPVYNSLLNILAAEGNVMLLKDLEARSIKGKLKEILATFSSEGRRKFQWWRQRPVMNGLFNAYAAQFPSEIIHYIPSLGILVKPIKGDAPAQLEEWQMDLFRGITNLERRIDISRFLRLAEIPRRNFMGALYKIIASGSVEVDLKGDIIEFRDENQLNQMISQLQVEFQAWKT